MQELREKVAVVTGAASGIGRALARRCLAEGMSVVLADVEPAALTAAEVDMRGAGERALGVLTDVSNPKDVERLAALALARFGAVHVLFNNAGVGLVGPRTWECTIADWSWILGVNLRGLVHGVRVFVPIMIEQGTECHIVNTASAAGLVSPPGMGVYNASKAAVLALSETLGHELALRQAPIKVSVLCPGLVATRMADSARNRPAALRNEPWVDAERRRRYAAEEEGLRRATDAGPSPDDVARAAFEAIRYEKFYVFTHPWIKEAFGLRRDNMLRDREPWRGSGYEEPA